MDDDFVDIQADEVMECIDKGIADYAIALTKSEKISAAAQFAVRIDLYARYMTDEQISGIIALVQNEKDPYFQMTLLEQLSLLCSRDPKRKIQIENFIKSYVPSVSDYIVDLTINDIFETHKFKKH